MCLKIIVEQEHILDYFFKAFYMNHIIKFIKYDFNTYLIFLITLNTTQEKMNSYFQTRG